jgi:hypothetical protein
VSKLTGNVDPQKIFDLAPVSSTTLPGRKAMNRVTARRTFFVERYVLHTLSRTLSAKRTFRDSYAAVGMALQDVTS